MYGTNRSNCGQTKEAPAFLDLRQSPETGNHNLTPSPAAKRTCVNGREIPSEMSERHNMLVYPNANVVVAILGCCAGNPSRRDIYFISTLIFGTGIRPGELRGLRWSDIDMDKTEMSIAFGHTRRTLKLDLRTLGVIAELREEAPEAK
jgi:hypothetical protein